MDALQGMNGIQVLQAENKKLREALEEATRQDEKKLQEHTKIVQEALDLRRKYEREQEEKIRLVKRLAEYEKEETGECHTIIKGKDHTVRQGSSVQTPCGTIDTSKSTFHAAIEYDGSKEHLRIMEVGVEWIRKLLRKNSDYGSAVYHSPVLCPDMPPKASILVRMSDKISRLSSLQRKGTAEVAESIDDTIDDLGAYCLLYRTAPDSKE